MYVCATTECFPDLPRKEALAALVDLEFASVELPIHEHGPSWFQPSRVASHFDEAVEAFRDTLRMNIAALSIDIDAEGDAYNEQFAACCRLACRPLESGGRNSGVPRPTGASGRR